MKRIIRNYRIELAAVFVILLGIFLLVEPFEIRETLYHWLVLLRKFISQIIAAIGAFVHEYRDTFTLSDFVGLVLITATVVFGAWRLRWRYLHSAWYDAETCPRCGADLRRIHRTKLDHFLSLVLMVKWHRYACKAEGCGWVGLKKPIHEGRRKKIR